MHSAPSVDFHGRLAAGRYFLGDPGFAMRIGLFQEALELKGGAPHAIVEMEGAQALLVKPSSGQASYPNTGYLNLSCYDCDSGYLGIVHESLLLRMSIIPGSMIRIVGEGVVSMVDGLLTVSDDALPVNVRIDTVWNRAAPVRRLPLAA